MSSPEVWLRGPLPGVPPLLQPVAHALRQAAEEVQSIMCSFPDQLLWKRPAGLASPGFHLQHMAGVLDRMCSYAQGWPLTEKQLEALAAEGKDISISTTELINCFLARIDETVMLLERTDESLLTETRTVGRKLL